MNKLPLKPGYLVLVLLGLVPVAVFMASDWPDFAGNAAFWLRWCGRFVGVLGLTLLLLTALVSIRLPRLDAVFGGLPHLWRVHRMMGFLGFLGVLLHIWLLAFASVSQSLAGATERLFPPLANWPVWLGWLSLLLLVVFLAPTFQFFGRLHYQRWKKLHLLSAPAVVLALVHTLALASPDWAWWLLGALALGAIVWRKLLSPGLGRQDWTVSGVERLKRDVVELRLKPVGKGLNYRPGQFVYLTPLAQGLTSGYREEHPFTIASAPSDPELRIGIKDLGDASHALQTIEPGSRVQIEGPYGDFFARRWPGRNQLWLGGGIGITPFISGARDLASRSDTTDRVHLIYLARDEYSAYYLDELKQVAQNHEAFEATAHYFRTYGPMTVEFLDQHCPDFRERELYICGPPGMLDHLLPLLKHAGIPASAIHSEVFDFL